MALLTSYLSIVSTSRSLELSFHILTVYNLEIVDRRRFREIRKPHRENIINTTKDMMCISRLLISMMRNEWKKKIEYVILSQIDEPVVNETF